MVKHRRKKTAFFSVYYFRVFRTFFVHFLKLYYFNFIMLLDIVHGSAPRRTLWYIQSLLFLVYIPIWLLMKIDPAVVYLNFIISGIYSGPISLLQRIIHYSIVRFHIFTGNPMIYSGFVTHDALWPMYFVHWVLCVYW